MDLFTIVSEKVDYFTLFCVGFGWLCLCMQTCVLKVNIHCDGCKHKVKKILQKIEGIFPKTQYMNIQI